MDLSPSDQWHRTWSSLRVRRIAVVAAIPITIPVWVIFGGVVGLVTTAAAVTLAVLELRSWPCPRCKEPFVGARVNIYPDRCASCELPSFERTDIVRRTEFTRAATVRVLSDRLRRTVGGAQVAGGALVMLTTSFSGGLPLWYRLLVESVGAVALAAGIWLWRDDARGYTWSRLLQALQLLRFSLPPLAYNVSAGPAIDLYFGDRASGINFGIHGQVVLAWHYAGPVQVSFNLLSAVWLLILLDARSRSSARPSGMRQFEVSFALPDAPPKPATSSPDERAPGAPRD